jgi:hypothetical protein
VSGVHDREQARDDDSGSSQAVSRAVSISRLIAITGMTQRSAFVEQKGCNSH